VQPLCGLPRREAGRGPPGVPCAPGSEFCRGQRVAGGRYVVPVIACSCSRPSEHPGMGWLLLRSWTKPCVCIQLLASLALKRHLGGGRKKGGGGLELSLFSVRSWKGGFFARGLPYTGRVLRSVRCSLGRAEHPHCTWQPFYEDVVTRERGFEGGGRRRR